MAFHTFDLKVSKEHEKFFEELSGTRNPLGGHRFGAQLYQEGCEEVCEVRINPPRPDADFKFHFRSEGESLAKGFTDAGTTISSLSDFKARLIEIFIRSVASLRDKEKIEQEIIEKKLKKGAKEPTKPVNVRFVAWMKEHRYTQTTDSGTTKISGVGLVSV